jgi:hypothetical protein
MLPSELGAMMMGETIARIAEGGNVELTDERMIRIAGLEPMSPESAAFLARSLLACAAILTLDKSVRVGVLIADVHIPVLKWTVSVGTDSRQPVVMFSIPPGIDLTFQLSSQVESDLGAALTAHAQGLPPPELPPDKLH